MDDQTGGSTFHDYFLARSILDLAQNELNASSLAVLNGETGLGLALVELAGGRSVTIYAGADNIDQEAGLLARGCLHVVSRDLDFSEEVMRISGGLGADVVVDQEAGPSFSKNFDLIADFGNVLVTGWGDGAAPGLFETMWAALDRCPCVQIWTADRVRAEPCKARLLEEATRSFLLNRPRLQSAIGA